MSKFAVIPDGHQNFWQLASIQIATIGLPGTIIGGHLAKEYGVGTAIVSVLIGNLLLWVIGLVIVLMSVQKRSNAIENVGDYLGRWGAMLASLILTVVFLIWYPINLGYAAAAIDSFSNTFEERQTLLSVAFGIFIALLSMGGIRLIRIICTVAFPILLLFLIYLFFITKNQIVWSGSWKVSFLATASVIAVILSGIVNLPTFFRHSRSKSHSIFALSLMTIFVSLFQTLTICIGISDPAGFFPKALISNNSIYPSLALLFIVAFSVCVNLGNIYFTSAVLDVFAPSLKKLLGAGRYALIGLIGSAIFVMPQWYFFNFMELEKIAEGFIACLDIILMIAFLVKIFVKHRIRLHEELSSSLC